MYNSRLNMHSGTSLYNQPVSTVVDELKFVAIKPAAIYTSAALTASTFRFRIFTDMPCRMKIIPRRKL
jgi:hypothetical protein